MKKQGKAVTEEVLDEKLKDIPRMNDLQQVAQDISDTFYDRFEQVDKKFEETDKKLDKILNVLDSVSKNISDMREEDAASTLHFERSDEAIADHEKRLKTLEAAKN